MAYIYVIESNNAYKVGFSKNPEKRLKSLQTGSNTPMKLLYKLEIETAKINIIERLIHKELSSYHIQGEWYKCPYSLIEAKINYVKIRYDNDSTDIFYRHKCLR